MVRISCKDVTRWTYLSAIVVLVVSLEAASAQKDGYYGKFIGKLTEFHHGVSGEVYAVDARTLHLRNFNYDGEGPAAYFYVGNSKGPGINGIRIRDERGTTNVLPKYRNRHITLTLPEGKTLQNIRWFSVWCDEFSVNFGDVRINKNFDFPRPQKISGLSGVHGVSSDPIVIVDAQTLLVPNFSYDGEAPDAKFWVGRGFKPSPQGIRLPDENGKYVPLRRYDRKTVVITLPGDLTVFDIGHFGVWCEAFTVDFGHVQIPSGLNIPPSLKMLGVSPQSKLNCEVLWDQLAFEVRWAVAGDSIVLQLVAKLDNGEYMSFGLSGDDTKSQMVGGDVTVAWVDKDTLKGHAYDYYLDAKSQCSGGRGSCPDDKILERSNSVRLLNAALVNGYSIVTYQRSLKPQDELDRQIFTNGSQPVIWAIGPLNSLREVSYHSLANRGNVFIDFGRSPKWNCPTPETNTHDSDAEESPSNQNQQPAQFNKQQRVPVERQQVSPKPETRTRTQVPTPAPAPKTNAWYIPPIQCHEPEDGVFYAQMGPTGGKRGYSAITGHVGWGISWYINGLLIPEINVVRGRTYTFIVEGGLDPEIPARYHPFYITDDPVGGYEYKTPEERANIQIFAGAVQNKRGEVRPTGVGRLCNWTPDPNQPPADEFASFGAYQRTLRLECDQGEPGIIQWTVDRDTPDTVYYQCYTHRYLGWKINVLDSCDTEGSGSNPVPSIVKAPADFFEKYSENFDEEPQESIAHATRVKPDYELKTNLAQEKNQTRVFANDFAKYQPQVTYVPEFTFYNEDTGETISPELVSKLKSQKEIEQLKAQYALKDPLIKQQAMLQNPQAVFRPQKVGPVRYPVSQQKVIPLDMSNMKNEEFINYFHVGKQEEALPSRQNYKVEVIVPKNPRFKLKPDLQEKPSIQIDSLQIPEQLKHDEKFNEELLKNYHLLKVQAEETLKKHKQKIQIYNKPTNRLPNGQIIGGQNRLQPALRGKPQHAVTLQQRPVPPGMFRPPFLPPPIPKQKRPAAPAVAAFHVATVPHRLNGGVRVPQKYIKQEPVKPEHQQYVELHKQLEGLGAQFESEALKLPTVIRGQQENVPLAVNTGFDPDSVKVEGGFKPILNTGIAPKFNVIDRADENVDEADDSGKIGVIDLTEEEVLGDEITP
ncbi:UNVERIFIED_CONTAM: hypothetical protein PYX00_004134 [Menopon gallinae]|uniref:Protein Skeletor n=1 Tax=Menopon gallinae TaxID=328185 RepID=A0AAW2I3C6_9NEOP